MSKSELEDVRSIMEIAMDCVHFAHSRTHRDYLRCERALVIIDKWITENTQTNTL